MFSCLVLFFNPLDKTKALGYHRGDFAPSLCVCSRNRTVLTVLLLLAEMFNVL